MAKIRIMQEGEWSVVFYVEDSGSEPVTDVLRGLDQRTKARFDWSLEQLRLRNVQAREPLVRHLEGKIWELRRESETNIYRLLYAFISGRRILIPARVPEENTEDTAPGDRARREVARPFSGARRR